MVDMYWLDVNMSVSNFFLSLMGLIGGTGVGLLGSDWDWDLISLS